MADVKVNEPHSHAPDDAVQKIQSFEEMLKKYGVKAKWKGHHADLKGTGVSGSIDVTGSEVRVVVKLGMLAKAAGIDAERLKGSIQRRLKDALA